MRWIFLLYEPVLGNRRYSPVNPSAHLGRMSPLINYSRSAAMTGNKVFSVSGVHPPKPVLGRERIEILIAINAPTRHFNYEMKVTDLLPIIIADLSR